MNPHSEQLDVLRTNGGSSGMLKRYKRTSSRYLNMHRLASTRVITGFKYFNKFEIIKCQKFTKVNGVKRMHTLAGKNLFSHIFKTKCCSLYLTGVHCKSKYDLIGVLSLVE